jgi:acyl-coenzyme A synthetase/AMP-(fatty) acid ligase
VALNLNCHLVGIFGSLKKDDIRFLKTILTGGEVVNSLTVEYLRNKFSSLSVVDGYGPTENTTFTTTYTVKQDTPKNIPIGMSACGYRIRDPLFSKV